MDANKQYPRVGAGVMILKDGKILLGKRHNNPEKASSALHGEGTWTMPGGKIDFGEKVHEGIIREVLEETGTKIKVGDLQLLSVTNDIVPDAHFVTIGFLCEKFEGELRVTEPDEIVEWRWFPLNDLPTPMYPTSKKMVEHYLAKKIYLAE
jgi:8-oxo-dGTP diphosphatase